MPRTKGSGIGNSFCRDKRKKCREIVEPGPGGKVIITNDLVPIYPANRVSQISATEVPADDPSYNPMPVTCTQRKSKSLNHFISLNL